MAKRQALVSKKLAEVPKGEMERVNRTLTHAEGEAALKLSEGNIQDALLDINKNYICEACIAGLRYLIPEGRTLTVRFRTARDTVISVEFGHNVQPRILVGDSFRTIEGGAKGLERFFAGF